MLKIVWFLNIFVLLWINGSCMALKDPANPGSLKRVSALSSFEIRGKAAADFKDIIASNCSDKEPFFQSLTCLYNVDDDGNGNFFVSRSCECKVGGKALRFKDSKDVLRVSEIMENLHMGEPGQRPSHRVYRALSLKCDSGNLAEMVCMIEKAN